MSKIVGKLKGFGGLLKETFNEWSAREPFNNAIIISYYTIFSLPGLLVIVLNLTGYFFGNEEVKDNLTSTIGGIIGGSTARDIENIIETSNKTEGTVLATILSIATLLFGATGVFYHLQQILNKIWEVEPHPKQKLLKFIRDRVFSLGLILIVGFLLLVSLVLSSLLSALSEWVSQYLSPTLMVLFRVMDLGLSLGITTLLFAAIYKFLPDAKIQWRDVWIGAFVTSLLFVIAKFALGLYFGNSNPASPYGAAGSIILILLWVSYAGMILFFGAEFTQVYARRHGREIEPVPGAVSTRGQHDNGAIVDKKPQPSSTRESNVPGTGPTGSQAPEQSPQTGREYIFERNVKKKKHKP